MSADAAPRTARKRRTQWAIGALVVVVIVAAVVLLAPRFLGGNKKSQSTVQTATVKKGSLTVAVSADGQTAAIDTYNVYPQVSGNVDKVSVSIGDHVKAGATLF
ncbi:MAG: hypothetical protein FDZ75_07095, partial [Actinobacteria bacterium]